MAERGIVRKQLVSQEFMLNDRIPPQAVDLEEAVLGAIMLESSALISVADILKPETFYKEAHQRIYAAIQNLSERSEGVDSLTVMQELKRLETLDIIGGGYYLSQLTSKVSSAVNIEEHAHIIVQKYIQRELIRISSDIIQKSYEDSTDVFELLDEAGQGIFNITLNNIKQQAKDLNILLSEARNKLVEASESETSLTGVPSGFTEIDRITGGWQNSDLIIVAARPGAGKSSFAISMAKNIIDFDIPVGVFSLEMSALQLVQRLISSCSDIDSNRFKRGNISAGDLIQIDNGIKQLIDKKLYIDDTASISLMELRAKARRLKEQFGVKLIIIDYLQLMVGNQKGNREQEVGSITRGLKALAKDLDMPIIAIAQLSREVEKRTNKRPILSDIRESGAAEADADIVTFIYRPEYYGITEDAQGNSTQGVAEIIIAKHRNGALKDVLLRFIPHLTKFEDLKQEYYSNEQPF